jgi:RimJ/RimL family protein N-acetyltransferase
VGNRLEPGERQPQSKTVQATMTTHVDYPTELECQVTLPDQRHLSIRPLRPGEEGPVRELDARLSTRTRYLRFFSPLPALPDSLLRLLASVDYRRRLSLIAEVDAGGRREVIALGSFGGLDNGTAEVALLVSDDWQHQGIGTILARQVMRAAEDRGFAKFVVHVFWDNTVIRRLLKRVGHIVSSRTSFGVAEVTFIRRMSSEHEPPPAPL